MVFTELRRDDDAVVSLVPGMQLISLVGFPLQKHLTTFLSRFCHRIIGRLGPNDGTVALADAIQWPGAIYPVWGADHYLQPPERARALIKAVLWYLGEPNEQLGGSDIGCLKPRGLQRFCAHETAPHSFFENFPTRTAMLRPGLPPSG